MNQIVINVFLTDIMSQIFQVAVKKIYMDLARPVVFKLDFYGGGCLVTLLVEISTEFATLQEN